VRWPELRLFSRADSRQASELSNRVSEAEMRMAMLMTMAGSRQSIDRNGNWVSGEALQRLIAQGGGVDANGMGGNNGATVEELVREMGLGTAGVGWSPDGRFLYAGTELGIFEFKVNLRDRMVFPSCELR